jgi:hypothetical protein
MKVKSKNKTKKLKCITKGFTSMDDIPKQFMDDKEIVIKSLLTARKMWVINNISKRLKKDPEVIKALKYKAHDERTWLWNSMKNKIDFNLKKKIVNRNDMIKLIKKISNFKKKRTGYDFKDSILLNASDELKDDKQIVLSCVKIVPQSYKDASPRLQHDDHVLKVLATNLQFDKNIKETIPNLNKVIALKLVIFNPAAYCRLTDYHSDKDIIIQALKDPAHIRSLVLPYIPNNMKKDKDIQKALDIKDPRYFSEKYNNDEKLILDGIKYDSNVIQYASNKLKNDKQFVIKYMKKLDHGYENVMKYFSKKIQNDRELYLLKLNDSIAYDQRHRKDVKRVLGNVDAEYYDLLSKYQ